MTYDIVILEDAKEFPDKLEPKMMVKSYRTIKMLSEFGPSLTLPHSRKIAGTDDLYELRVQVATNICRLFYFYYNEGIYIILSGFVKKRDKTDPNEIERALKIRKEYVDEKEQQNKLEEENNGGK
ncbi:MAG: type II toxin-antitoxin system RelE/ParE family toxin [Spirochaetales bacterium]|jgi:phage-related protein|nr:type II toxin-antitoxin system RelE/ParE family toxin [Spirochaetales bacterium]